MKVAHRLKNERRAQNDSGHIFFLFWWEVANGHTLFCYFSCPLPVTPEERLKGFSLSVCLIVPDFSRLSFQICALEHWYKYVNYS